MKNKRRHAFSLVELLIVMAIIMILAAFFAATAQRGREQSHKVGCINNLRTLSMSLQLYYNEHQSYPTGVLREDLSLYLEPDTTAYACPATRKPYEHFYVPRRRPTSEEYVLGCPYHGVVSYRAGRGTRGFRTATVRHDGATVPLGSDVGPGEIRLEDGAVVKVRGANAEVMILTSVRREDGTLYSILRLFRECGAAVLDVTVPPEAGSDLEIITPAAIAGVAGTKFRIQVNVTPSGHVKSRIQVFSGAVKVTPNSEEEPMLLTSGSPAKVVVTKPRPADSRWNRPPTNLSPIY